MASAAHTSRAVDVSVADICKTRWNVDVIASSVDEVLLLVEEVVDVILVLEDGVEDVDNISSGKNEFISNTSLYSCTIMCNVHSWFTKFTWCTFVQFFHVLQMIFC